MTNILPLSNIHPYPFLVHILSRVKTDPNFIHILSKSIHYPNVIHILTLSKFCPTHVPPMAYYPPISKGLDKIWIKLGFGYNLDSIWIPRAEKRAVQRHGGLVVLRLLGRRLILLGGRIKELRPCPWVGPHVLIILSRRLIVISSSPLRQKDLNHMVIHTESA